MKSLSGLAFLPPDNVEEIFDTLSEAFPEEEDVDLLLSYFKSTYIQGPVIRRVRRPAMFPIGLWNHYEHALRREPKTTNCAEGWHNTLRSLFMASHPSIWTFFRGINKDIAIQRLVIVNDDMANGRRPTKKYADLAQRLSVKVASFHEEVDKLKYLRYVSYMS